MEVRQLITDLDTIFNAFQSAIPNEVYWTIVLPCAHLDDPDDELAEEWLVIRHENDERYTYALSNAPWTLLWTAWPGLNVFVILSSDPIRIQIRNRLG